MKIICNEESFSYDIHSLVKAFYPEKEVQVRTFFAEEEPFLRLFFDKEKLTVSWQGGEKSCSLIETGRSLSRPEQKNALKYLLYQVLQEITGKSLPWGTLTGIRPTKIPMTMLEQGESDENILRYMEEHYLVTPKKAALSLEIAARENALLQGIAADKGYSLYIGIPFCPTTCLYCSFTSYPIISWKKRVAEYLNALEKELDFVAERFAGKSLDSVYIGGGTPTTLEPEELERLLGAVETKLSLAQVREYTVESGRPDSITPEKLQVLKRHGVTRISVNPQTMNQKTLDVIGRRHTVEETVRAFEMARAEGFDNINMDIILGLPEENGEDVEHTLAEIAKLSPDSLTIHSLAVKRASHIHEWIKEKGLGTLSVSDALMNMASQRARDMGLLPYYLYRQKNMSGNLENVGFAAEGKFGLYNILIMEEVQSIVALGAGTVTKRVYGDGRIERCDNVKDVALYISKIEEMIDRKRQLFADYNTW